MTESLWQKPNATLSHKNACKEFRFTEEVLIEAMKSGKLQYQINYAHGNPYYRVLRGEVEALALEMHGAKGIEEQKIEYELKKTNSEINSCKRKLTSLEKQKFFLTEALKKLKD
jgi:50S ribosomal subunit-associated GTPase HflX